MDKWYNTELFEQDRDGIWHEKFEVGTGNNKSIILLSCKIFMNVKMEKVLKINNEKLGKNTNHSLYQKLGLIMKEVIKKPKKW